MNVPRCLSPIVAAFFCAAAACGTPPAPQPARAPTSAPPRWSTPPPATVQSMPLPPPSAPVQASLVPAAAYTPPPVIVIHEAELYGELHARAGTTVTIASKVITTRTEPEIGNKGVLLQRLDTKSVNDVWVPVADVVVKSKLDKQSQISVTITAEKKDFPAGQKVVPFAPKSRMRLKWEWQ